MAGHSKWANIQHRKNAQDAKRGKLFTKLIREITVSASLGGGDPDANPRLRAAIDKALGANMTRDTVDRAIKRGAGEQDMSQVDELRYEGYGPAGVAILIDCMTDNRNRTVTDVRTALRKRGGNLGTEGSVAYLFTKLGQLAYAPGSDEDKIMEAALEAGAHDIVTQDDGSIEVTTSPEHFGPVKDAISKAGFETVHAEVSMVAATQVTADKELAESILGIIEALEDLDDVQEVYTNIDIPEEVLKQL
ncbi:MAG: YebC/PmpR family DNA-binding transcriptional regulator [Gammaproteobacteria bacterium]|nr:YebC/PmpR family DNA-binding transcriptional regulator [Gammaproteobacteria bacterium]